MHCGLSRCLPRQKLSIDESAHNHYDEAILNSAPIPNSVDTRGIWPEEWSPRHGFKWEVETEQSDDGKEVEESNSEFDNSSGFVEMGTPEIGIAQADE